MAREFRQPAQRAPSRRALRERLRLGIRAAFSNPLPQLFPGYRAVLPAVRADDLIHAHLFLFAFDSHAPQIRANTAFGARHKV